MTGCWWRWGNGGPCEINVPLDIVPVDAVGEVNVTVAVDEVDLDGLGRLGGNSIDKISV